MQGTEDFLCDKRHIGMKKLQRIAQNCFQSPECCCLGVVLVIVQPWFYHLDIPVTELLPDKVINFLDCNAQLVFIQVLRNLCCQGIYFGEYPLFCAGQCV